MIAFNLSAEGKDYVNTLVHDVVSRYDLIAVEDVRSARMVHGNLAKRMLDAGWNSFVLQERTRLKAPVARSYR